MAIKYILFDATNDYIVCFWHAVKFAEGNDIAIKDDMWLVNTGRLSSECGPCKIERTNRLKLVE